MAAVTLAACGTTSTKGDSLDARVFCKYLVQDQLKAPASASFSGSSDTTTTSTGSGGWIVKGYVDSQNDFGATVRSDYDCRVGWVGDKWVVNDLKITRH